MLNGRRQMGMVGKPKNWQLQAPFIRERLSLEQFSHPFSVTYFNTWLEVFGVLGTLQHGIANEALTAFSLRALFSKRYASTLPREE